MSFELILFFFIIIPIILIIIFRTANQTEENALPCYESVIDELEVLNRKETIEGGLWTKDRERVYELRRIRDEHQARNYRNGAYGIAGSAIAIGSILVDSHNDHERMLDVDRRTKE